jgi:hypothetical protein
VRLGGCWNEKKGKRRLKRGNERKIEKDEYCEN